MEQLDRFKKAVEYLKTKAKKQTNEGVSELLRYKTLSYISDVIGGSKPISDLLLDRMVENSINKEWIMTGKGKMIIELTSPDAVMINNNEIIYIELKTASGKTIQVKPEGQSEITLLNAFLEERDRVIDTIKEEKQARIDELTKDKDGLAQLLSSALEKIYSSQQVALAYQKAWVDYEAEKIAKGDQKKKKEIMYKMSKLVDGIIQNDASKGIPDEIGKLSKEGQ